MLGSDCSGKSGNDWELPAAQRLLAGFSHASVIGFAVLDEQFRYRALNNALASINGFTVDAHLGNTVGDLFGNLGLQTEFAFQKVLATGRAESPFEVSGLLPARTEVGHWIDAWFPIATGAGRAKQVGLLVVEVTTQRKLQRYMRKLERELLQANTTIDFLAARELNDAIEQYNAALALSLRSLTNNWLPEKTTTPLARAVESLDERIVTMRTLMADVASRFLINQPR